MRRVAGNVCGMIRTSTNARRMSTILPGFCQFHLHRWHSRRVWPLLCAGDTYDCGKEVKLPTLDRSTKYRCAGPVRCMGEDCLSVDQEASTDFAKAAALLQAAQFMT